MQDDAASTAKPSWLTTHNDSPFVATMRRLEEQDPQLVPLLEQMTRVQDPKQIDLHQRLAQVQEPGRLALHHRVTEFLLDRVQHLKQVAELTTVLDGLASHPTTATPHLPVTCGA